MKTFSHFITAFLCTLVASGCSHVAFESLPVLPSSNSTNEWTVSDYTIRFIAGPVEYRADQTPVSHSIYEVRYQKPHTSSQVAIAISSLDIKFMEGQEAFHVHEITHLFLSPSTKRLLIDESVPNDGRPCSNYILFERTDSDIRISYLKLPLASPAVSRAQKANPYSPAPIFQQLPSVTSLSDDTVHFRYPNGQRASLAIADIPCATGPAFP